MSPIPPSAFKALTSSKEEPLRDRIVKFLKFMVLFTRWYLYAFDSVGQFTPAYKEHLCSVDCSTTTT